MLYLEDLKIGDRFISREYEITLDEIKQFASHYDPQPFHTDEELAKKIQSLKVLPLAGGILRQLLCAYGLNACRFMVD